MILTRHHVLVVPFVLAAAVACGGAQPPAETAPAGTASAAEAPPPANSAEAPATAPTEATPAPSAPAEPKKPGWSDMSVEQKKEVMKTAVLPTMKGLFQEFDSKRFSDVKCATCHGQGAKDGKFAMPNPGLPKLDPAGDFAKHVKKDPKIVKFMMERVVPEVAKIIGEPPWDPATNKGFGCGNCHQIKG